MGNQLSNIRIVGVALTLFSAVLLGVGIHHLISTGTCSSTGYSANYGPVPTCPAGTGWWFLFVFAGIIGSLIGSLMAGSIGLVFASIFGAIGFGALTLLFDSNVQSSTKTFGGIFGGCFALVGVIAGAAVIGSAIGSLRSGSGAAARPGRAGPSPAAPGASAFGTPTATSAFGSPAKDADPIMSAYNASRGTAARVPGAPLTGTPLTGTPLTGVPTPTPLNLVSGLQAAAKQKGDAVDELAKLAELHKQGALTDAEFASAKAKLLGKM